MSDQSAYSATATVPRLDEPNTSLVLVAAEPSTTLNSTTDTAAGNATGGGIGADNNAAVQQTQGVAGNGGGTGAAGVGKVINAFVGVGLVGIASFVLL